MYHQRVLYHSTVKGEKQYVNNDVYLSFLESSSATSIRKAILAHFRNLSVFDPTKALSIQDLADLQKCGYEHIRNNINVLIVLKLLLPVQDQEKPNLTRYYLNKEHFAPLGITELPSAVDKYYKGNND